MGGNWFCKVDTVAGWDDLEDEFEWIDTTVQRIRYSKDLTRAES